MRLQELMRTRVVTIGSDESASAARSRMRKHRIRHLVVTSDGELAGILSERDLAGPHEKKARTASSVGDLMNRRVVSAQPTTTLRKAANLMSGNTIGSLPVLEHGKLVGIVTATDVFDALGRGRASFAAAVPKAMKLESAAEPSQIPAHIRAADGDLSATDRARIRSKLGRRLGKFAGSLERVSVRTKDVNGPRGGIDRLCRIKVVLSGLPSVVFEHRDSSLVAAVDGALAGVERAVRRALRRRRMKPLRRAA